jgi:radical SAM superfamily enzyme YgiQ (UPF0313 family)
MLPKILLVALNAKYIHTSFGLRYLHANMRELKKHTSILEYDINQKVNDIAESILQCTPEIVGFGVYIWNIQEISKLAFILKKLKPKLKIIVGGPEVSFEYSEQKWLRHVDHVITGEADLAFYKLCKELTSINNKKITPQKIIHASVPDVKNIVMPYELYTSEDVKNRIVYVEASRGCPFTCEFCLSSLDVPVRAFPLDSFLNSMDQLFKRGLRHFKFVDRTFNLNIQTGKAILNFFLERLEPDLFLHFEMIPDRLPEPLREIIAKFPNGSIQFEIGIQSFNPEVSKNISRRQNLDKLEDNLTFLRTKTGVHLHVDLIAGLPGENLESFGEGFDRLVRLNPQEIQIGILKRLRGTPIVRHDHDFRVIYDDYPPYEVLNTIDVQFDELQRIKRFARYWDLVGNSGNFVKSVHLIWRVSQTPFVSFLGFSDWVYKTTGRRHGIALTKLLECVFQYLVDYCSIAPSLAAETLWEDYKRGGRSDRPIVLRPYLEESTYQKQRAKISKTYSANKRQSTHKSV